MNEQKKHLIITTIFKILGILVFSFIIYIILAICSLFLRHRISLALTISAIAIFGCLFLAWLIVHKPTRKILLWCTLGCLIASISLTGGMIGFTNELVKNPYSYDTNINVKNYMPFEENSGIARLDDDSNLKFTILDDLPRLDGAAALFPMYSAFVNATYPSNIPVLNDESDGQCCFYYTNTKGAFHYLSTNERDIIFGVDPNGDYETYEWDEETFPLENLEKKAIGREGFIFFTNRSNSVDSLTVEQLRAIYGGSITNWSQVGGSNIKIRAYTRNEGSGSYNGFVKFMDGTPIKNFETETIVQTMDGIIEAVADYENFPGAIGYSYYTYASQLMANPQIKILAVNGIYPQKTTIGNNTYPITDSFYMFYDKTKVTTQMSKLMNWILSSQGQELVDKSGYSPVN